MSKALIIVGSLVLILAIAGFAIDFLPVDAFESASNDVYIKIVPADESSFDWVQLRLSALFVGAILVVVGKFIGGKKRDI